MAIDLDVHGNTKPLEAAVQAAINRIRRQPIKITVDDKGATQPLGNMKRAADEFSKSMEAANARILAFGASMAIINGVADAFKGMVRNLVQVEKSLADINVVMGLSNQNLEQFGDGLFKVAKETGAAFRVAADAATEYARQGLAVEETLKRTRDALVLTRLTGMDSAEAVKSLTAAMNTYGNQIKDTTQLVSKFAAVDVQFAVSAEDFAAAISRTGQAAKSAGVDIDELIGIVTSAQQQTARGGAVIGNALKTIFTKTGRTDTLNQLENLGIAVRDLEGNTIGAKRILTDLANTFDTLSEAQKAQITQTMGGLFHINILKAVLSDAAKQNGILANATQISANATDEAIQKNEQLRKTMDAMASETGNAIKQLSVQIGELMLAPGMEKILNTVKSLAEGASDILGDGESAGNQFANGFLKGLGNVITGPGLVVLTTVFVKLFMTAAKFTKESLSSLIGVTSEAQKQKAIQTSLVALIGQNAALGKEMLRTDISRTEKEKILLGLLKMQTAEAERLNAVSQKLASTLYTKGYGPGLTQGKRRAYGHIPNFADPERAQAAKGGYAAGSIRTMNMPGEGSVIYNSAETVKNFAGFKQPAIMPPQSSKAGKNYQQAFGNIHGFDPYAAGGFIPNFDKRSGKGLGEAPTPRNLQSKKLGTLNADSSLILLTADSSADGKSQFFVGKEPGGDIKVLNTENLASKRTTGFYEVKVPYYSLDKSDKDKKSKTDLPAIQEAIMRAASNKALDIAKAIVGGEKNLKPYNKKQIEETFNKGAFKGAAGSTFESAIAASLKSHLFQDYKARTDTSAIDLPYDPRMFQFFGAPAGHGKMGAEVKADLAKDLQQGAATKFFQVLTGGRAAWEYKDKDYKDKTGGRAAYAGLERRGSGYFKKGKAYGHIPNFADPLSDAIGREKAAGVPVSQIRVGSHSALMSKGNPLGLGVTNTHDEPNGLRDVFGANGFVPNYAFDRADFVPRDVSSGRFRSTAKLAKRANRELSLLLDSWKEGRISNDQLSRGIKNLATKHNIHADSLTRVTKTTNESITPIQRLTAARKRFTNHLGSGTSKFGGNAGMMMMIGAPMAAGYLQSGGAEQGGFAYNTGGAMQGAATGAMMTGMIAPFLGPAAPFVVAAGALYGAFDGWNDAMEQNTKALEEQKKVSQQNTLSNIGQAAPVFQAALKESILSKQIGSIDPAQYRLSSLSLGDPGKTTGTYRPTESFASTSLKDILSDENLLKQDIAKQFYKMLPKSKVKQDGKEFMVPSFDPYNFMSEEERIQYMVSNSENISEISTEARKKMLTKALRNMPQEEFMAKSVFAKPEDKPRSFTPAKYAEELEKVDVSTVEGRKQINEAIGMGLDLERESNAQRQRENQAIILQLDIQKIMLESQKRAKEAQFNISASMQSQASNLSLMEKTMGGFATEQQKAQLKYIGSINKAAETYASSAQRAESAFESSMLGILKDEDVKSKVKTALAKRIKQRGGRDVDASKLDVSDEFLKLSEKERQEMYTQLKLGDEITKNIENQVTIRQNALSLAEKQVNQSRSIAQAEFSVNEAIAKRKDLISDMKTSAGIGAETVGSAGRIRAMDAQVAAAERLGALGPGYQTSADQEAFQMEEKRIALQNKSLEIREQANKKMNDELIKLAGLKMQDEELIKLKEKGINLSPQEFANLQALEATSKKRKEEQDNIVRSVERTNKEAEKEISTAEKLLELEEKRLKAKRAHETGPGAFGNGMTDAFKSMRDQVAIMDYELGKRIPTAFADGLAGAMTEALNGTKSIKEALSDAALSFLQMIQQAMMQKAAYSMVGAMGFSQGGNVRNYSRGGGVPARVSNGEYVMGKDAVRKYGGSFMHSLNAGGQIPGFSDGGSVERDLIAKGTIRRESNYSGSGEAGSALAANFGGGRGFKSGRMYQRKAMSGAFYTQSGNVGLEEDTAAVGSILQEEERRRQEAEAKRQAKKAKRRQLIGSLVGIAAGAAISKFSSFAAGKGWLGEAAKSREILKGVGVSEGSLKQLMDNTGMSLQEATTTLHMGKLGQPAAIDKLNQVTGGQALAYTGPTRKSISGLKIASSSRQYGSEWKTPTRPKPWDIEEESPFTFNYGGMVRKYASGGHISGKSGIDQIPAMLSEGEYVIKASSARQIGRPMLDRINAGKFNDGGIVGGKLYDAEQKSSGNASNSINISINIDKSGSASESSSGDKSKETGDLAEEKNQTAQMANKIKQQVLSVISEEKRPGGLLY